MPRVSVIIPNYNHARFLTTRLESVFAQTYQDFEVIILDDGSSDNSREVIASYLTDARVRFYPSDVNSGSPFVQWNKGVALAHGEFVWIAESDDFSDPRFLATLIPPLEDDAELGLCYCQSDFVDDDDKKIAAGVEWTDDLDPHRWVEGFVNRGPDECANFLVWKNTIPNASGVVFRRSVFEKAGGAPINMRLCGDWMLWARMLMQSSIRFEPRTLNFFRYHDQSVRARTPPHKNFGEFCQVQNFILRRSKVSKETQTKILKRRREFRKQMADFMISEIWEFHRRRNSLVASLIRLVLLPAKMPTVLGNRFYWGTVRKMLFIGDPHSPADA